MKKILMISLLSLVAGCDSPATMSADIVNGPAMPVFFQSFSAALDESARERRNGVGQEGSETVLDKLGLRASPFHGRRV